MALLPYVDESTASEKTREILGKHAAQNECRADDGELIRSGLP